MRRLTAWALTATLVLPNVSYARADEADLFADSVKLESVEKEAAAQTSEKDEKDPSDLEYETGQTDQK